MEDAKCDGKDCGQTIYSYTVIDGKRYGKNCCAHLYSSAMRIDSAILNKKRTIAGKTFSEIEIRRVQSQKPMPDGTSPCLKRYRMPGDLTR